MKTFIYSLCDPITEEVRYIGKTDQYLKQRLYSHIIVVSMMEILATVVLVD